MIRRASLLTRLSLALLAAGWARAEGTLDVVSSVPTRIYLDGEYVGEAPLRLSGIAAGDHQVQAESPTTGEVRTFRFHSPTNAHVEKRLDVDQGALAAPVPATVLVPRSDFRRVRTVTVAAPTCVVSPPARVWAPTRSTWNSGPSYSSPVVYAEAPYRTRRETAKVHTRNALLGATLASQVFTDNSRDRKRFRNVGLGLTVLNELFR